MNGDVARMLEMFSQASKHIGVVREVASLELARLLGRSGLCPILRVRSATWAGGPRNYG